MSSSLSSKVPLNAAIHSLPSSSSSSSSSTCLVSKRRFIWRFPPSKFHHLPSCASRPCSSIEMTPLNIGHELVQRQELSIFLCDLGHDLNVSFTCIYTSVVYMHRFFMVHPFQQYLKESVAAACLFLACKVSEMPRPLSEFTRHLCQRRHPISDQSDSSVSPSSLRTRGEPLAPEIQLKLSQQIIDYENLLLSTLGFCFHVDQPYAIITKASQRFSMTTEITHKAYDIATISVFFTIFSMKYTNNLIACFALYLAMKSSETKIENSDDGSQWFHSLNEEFTEKLLQELVDEYELIYMQTNSTRFDQCLDQLRKQRKLNQPTVKSIAREEQSSVLVSSYDHEQHSYPIATTSGSIRSTASSSSSSSSSIAQHQHRTSHDQMPVSTSMDIHYRTPSRSTAVDSSQMHSTPIMGTSLHSPMALPQRSSPLEVNANSLLRQQLPMSMSSAKPIPTLMSSSHSLGTRHYSRTSTLSQRLFRPPPPPPAPHPMSTGQQFHPAYRPDFQGPSLYYVQQTAPLYYQPIAEPSMVSQKRYGEPPAPPMKRCRYNVDMHQSF